MSCVKGVEVGFLRLARRFLRGRQLCRQPVWFRRLPTCVKMEALLSRDDAAMRTSDSGAPGRMRDVLDRVEWHLVSEICRLHCHDGILVGAAQGLRLDGS